jgi:hypothetical protein
VKEEEMNYYKILNEDENHYDLQYKTGLNIDPIPFNPSGNCQPGGIYFAREDILAFLGYGPWIREVTLSEDARVYENPWEPTKWKADKVILGKRRKITAKVIKQLIEEGADVHAGEDGALRWASTNGHTDVVKLLLEHGADVHAQNDAALRWASTNGHTDLVKILLEHGADVHVDDDDALRWASEKGHLHIVKYLVEQGADIHARDDEAFKEAKHGNHKEILEYLNKQALVRKLREL